MTNYRTLIVGSLAIGLALTGASSSPAGSVARGDTATLSFNRPVALPGVTLTAGAYVFEVVDAGSLEVVRVSKQATGTPQFMGFTHRVGRPDRLRGRLSAVTIGEARPGEPAPITVWYPADGSDGRRFIY
ncbi:MAG TPA: hypothetical protein VIY56_11825 [Vicinamibacterales bacterium]